MHALAYARYGFRDTRMRRLDLFADRRRSVSLTGSPDDRDPDSQSFDTLIAEIVSRLSAHAPDLPVRAGEWGWTRMAFLAMGTVALVLGLVIGGFGAADERYAALFPAVLLISFGAVIALANAPWRKGPSTTVAELAGGLADDHARSD